MMEINNFDAISISDKAILENIGTFLKETRLRQNKTQEETATAAGMNRSTLSQIENGSGGTLLSIVQILRVLGQLHLLQSFQVPALVSPLALAKLERQKRQRSSPKQIKKSGPKSDW